MNERIKELRKALNLTQTQFGDSLGITHSAVAHFEKGTVNMSQSTIKSICREFNVNENWLLTGEGEMFNELSDDELVARYVGRMFAGGDPFVINTLKALGKLSPDQWEVLKELVDTIAGE